MKIAVVTEMGFEGKISSTHSNMRTEFAWMHRLDAVHHSIYSPSSMMGVLGYDKVFIIMPKGQLFLNAVGVRLVNQKNQVSELLDGDLVGRLRSQGNKEIFYIQEGPHWLWNDYEIIDQLRFYNFLSSCDGIYAHNQMDTKYYRGLIPNAKVNIIPTLMIDTMLTGIDPQPENKVIIGGNFARWYGGFESYIIAQEFNLPIWAQTSHARREHEELIDNLTHLPRLMWLDWMKELSKFKYAVHLMPTVAAGTFSLNCAYFGIPTIGNIEVDTQRVCHPALSVDVYDLEQARKLAASLRDDIDFYNECSAYAKAQYHQREFSI